MAEPYKLRIERDLRPAYYDKFRCIAADCCYTCCKGWRIAFDKKDYLSLKRQNGTPELNASMKKTLRRLKKGLMPEYFYGEFDLAGGSCPLQRPDGLCSLQLEKGHDALPRVCKIFPRSEVYHSSGYLERSLSPACEGVLELMWDLSEGVDFVSDLLSKKERNTILFQEHSVLRNRYQDIRSKCIDFLQNRKIPFSQRVLLMGLALKDLADGETDIDAWISKSHVLEENIDGIRPLVQTDRNKVLPLFLSNNMKVLFSIINTQNDFTSVQDELLSGLGVQLQDDTLIASVPISPYLEAESRYKERFPNRDIFMENLMVSLFFHLQMPKCNSGEDLWKSYVNFCNLCSFYRFMSVMSCREGASGDKTELFRLMVCASRGLIHNSTRQAKLRDELFENESSSLAHMAILLRWD